MSHQQRQSQTARRIRAELAARGLSQADLCREFKLHPNTVCAAINHGLNHPTRERILRKLGLSETADALSA